VTTPQSTTNIAEIHDLTHPESWSKDVLNPATDSGAIDIGLIFLVAAWLVGRALRLAIHRYLDKAEHAGMDTTGVRFLGKLAGVAVYVFAFMMYSHVIPGLQHLGSGLLTSVGLVSVVVGLAAQSTLGNLISGISLVLYRPFKVGDQLQVSGPKGVETGMVESINLGTTILRTADDRRLVIPNNTMASTVCINLSATRKGAPCALTVILAAAMDPGPARKILVDLAKAHPKTVTVDGCDVTALSGSGTTLTLNVWCADGDTAVALKSDLLESAKKQFDAAGIKIARWSRTLN
jgi:small conductance mechanosensitive channel